MIGVQVAPEEFAATVGKVNAVLERDVPHGVAWFLAGYLVCVCTLGLSLAPALYRRDQVGGPARGVGTGAGTLDAHSQRQHSGWSRLRATGPQSSPPGPGGGERTDLPPGTGPRYAIQHRRRQLAQRGFLYVAPGCFATWQLNVHWSIEQGDDRSAHDLVRTRCAGDAAKAGAGRLTAVATAASILCWCAQVLLIDTAYRPPKGNEAPSPLMLPL